MHADTLITQFPLDDLFVTKRTIPQGSRQFEVGDSHNVRRSLNRAGESQRDSQHDSLLNTVELWVDGFVEVCYDTTSCHPLPFDELLSCMAA